MNGYIFGKDIRILRNKKGISSRELSKRIGRGEAYISQIEGGKIKNPDYDTCFKLLQILDVQEDQIEKILYEQYNIKSPEREAADLVKAVRRTELHTNDFITGSIFLDTNIHINNFRSWFELPKEDYKHTNKMFYSAFDNLIEMDSSTAQKVMPNIASIIKNKDDFYFLCMILEHDLTKIKIEDRHKILHTLSELASNAV